jgi:hypothetical protein
MVEAFFTGTRYCFFTYFFGGTREDAFDSGDTRMSTAPPPFLFFTKARERTH